MKKSAVLALSAAIIITLSACGKKPDSSAVTYEIVDGRIVETVKSDGSASSGAAAGLPDNYIPSSEAGAQVYTSGDSAPGSSGFSSGNGNPYAGTAETGSAWTLNGDPQNLTAEEAGSMDISTVNEGISYFSTDEYNSLDSDTTGLIDGLKIKLETASEACREIYAAADKGSAYNVSLSSSDIAAMTAAIGAKGYPAVDSNGELNMQCWEVLDEFGTMQALTKEDIRETYFVVYPDGHITAFMLSRESGVWHLYSTSMAWNADGSFHIYSEGRYAVGEVRYTDKGWLIYSRDTSDFDENQKANTDSYVMVRVKPLSSELTVLCRRYVEPVGYFENNLFTTNWNQSNFAPVDFNSLYAYLFGMYHGTEMLSSYNVRNYYKAVQGTRLYVVPTEEFETVTTTYFNIDRSALKNISDYSSAAGGYFFLGYSYDYYNVTPRTPFPEVVSAVTNSDGSITMVVDAVNPWYGTDRAFRHELTVMPGSGSVFKYVSNRLIEDENNILPQQKLSEMLNVERSKTTYTPVTG